MNQRFDPAKPMQVGGQAVLEGVMMRAPGMISTAVRRATGEIVVRSERYASLGEKHSVFKLPVLRGAAGLIEMMFIGIRTLDFSAEIALQDVDGAVKDNGHATGNGAGKSVASSSKDNLKLGLTVAFSLALGGAIFFVTPILLTTTFFGVDQEPFAFNLLAGGIRVAMLIAYLLAISMIKDIHRLFQYHGAEHKAVFAFERGEGLTVAAAARQSRFHPRCGTSFLLIVMMSSILLFSILDTVLMSWLGELTLAVRLLTHLPLIPLVGGISYEFIKASAKRSETFVGRIVVAPGLWLQKITTKEPDESMLEVAVVALRSALGQGHDAGSPISVLAMQEVSVN